MSQAPPTGPVSIVIKAYNEAQRIGACLESALQALADIGGEVVLADSGSSDATVAIAQRYPVRIVQLAHPEERCCGIGAQLGFEHARGAFIYLMDGDMQLSPRFLPAALELMHLRPTVGGVGGRVLELNSGHLEYRARAENPAARQAVGAVDRLDGGGLYRRSAIESVGYLADRNLHSYEEFELGLRLREQGWTLWRLPLDAVSHQGHQTPPYRLLMRRWRSGYILGIGELLRASWRSPQRLRAVLGLHEVRLYLGLLLGWLLLIAWLLAPLPIAPALAVKLVSVAALPAALVLAMGWRKRSFERGLYALVAWHCNSAGLLRGLLRRRRPAAQAVSSRLVQPLPAVACAPQSQAPSTNPQLAHVSPTA
ncbi:MAG: glycosyltransferase [Betaproteobacteria bacterium]